MTLTETLDLSSSHIYMCSLVWCVKTPRFAEKSKLNSKCILEFNEWSGFPSPSAVTTSNNRTFSFKTLKENLESGSCAFDQSVHQTQVFTTSKETKNLRFDQKQPLAKKIKLSDFIPVSASQVESQQTLFWSFSIFHSASSNPDPSPRHVTRN